jgi:hypothetical protein
MNDALPIARAQAAETVSKNAVCHGLHELAEIGPWELAQKRSVKQMGVFQD